MRPAVRIFATALTTLVSLAMTAGTTSSQEVTRDPARVRLEVDDLHRFARAQQEMRSGGDSASVLEHEYLAQGSPGLRSYAARYQLTATSQTRALRAHPGVFANAASFAESVAAAEPELRKAFGRLRDFFPDAAFPPIWFFVGHNGPAGLAQPEGVLIAIERVAHDPAAILALVMHELAHFQQAMVQGPEQYRRIYGPDQTLLALALREGSAELIAELTAGRHINPAAERYGLAHEPELWERFRREMRNRDPGDWMFVQPAKRDWPPDLGYWIGYRIVRAYYERATDKQQAIRDVLTLTDFDGFLEASGYDPPRRR